MSTIQRSIDEFIFHCQYEKNLSSKTLKAYKIDLKQFLAFKNVELLSIEEIDKNILKLYIQHLFEIALKEKTIKRKLATLKVLFNYLEFDEQIVVNPFRKIRVSIKEPKRVKIDSFKNLFLPLLHLVCHFYKCGSIQYFSSYE